MCYYTYIARAHNASSTQRPERESEGEREMTSKLTTAQDKFIETTAKQGAQMASSVSRKLIQLGLLDTGNELTDTGRAYATERGWLAPVVTETPHTMDKPVDDVHEEAATPADEPKLTVWWKRMGLNTGLPREDEHKVSTPEEAVAILKRLAAVDLANDKVTDNMGGLLDYEGDEWYSIEGETAGMDIREYEEWLDAHSADASSTPEAESAAPDAGAMTYVELGREYTRLYEALRKAGLKPYVTYNVGDMTGDYMRGEILTMRELLSLHVTTPTSDRAIEGAVVVEAVAGQAITSMGDVEPFYHSMSKDEVFDNLVEYLCEWDFKAIVDEHVENETEMRVANTIFQLVASRAWEIYKQPKAESQHDTLQAELTAARSQIAAITGALETIANNLDEMAANPHKSGDHIRSWAETMLKIANKALG